MNHLSRFSRRAIALSLTALTALAPLQPGLPTLPRVQAAAPDRSLADLLDLVRPGVIKVQTEKGMGTGFVVRADGQALTAAHVVSGATNITATFADGRRVAGSVVRVDTERDVALLQLSSGTYAPLTLGSSARVRQGERAFTMGMPVGQEFTASEGIISALRDTNGTSVAGSGAPRYIQLTAAISPGNSGGPVFNTEGQVIGIAIFKKTDGENVNFALAIDEAHGLVGTTPTFVPAPPPIRFAPEPTPTPPPASPPSTGAIGATQTNAFLVVATQGAPTARRVTVSGANPLGNLSAIQTQWAAHNQVIDVVETGSGWEFVFAPIRDRVNTIILTGSSFPTERVRERMNLGEVLTSATYGHGRWVVVISKMASGVVQRVLTSDTYPREWINERWSEGYRVTAIQEGNGIWMVAMTSGVPLGQQWIQRAKELPKDWLQARWSEGYKITTVGTAENGFVFVASKGSTYGAQKICTNKDMPSAWLRDREAEGYAITAMR